MNKLFFVCIILYAVYTKAQVLPASRAVDWSLSGYGGTLPNYTTIADITTYGGIGNGITSNDSAFAAAVNSLAGNNGVIYFPAGTYLFNATLNLRSGLIVRGSAADSTTLKFDLNGSNAHAINIAGNSTNTTALITNSAAKDSSVITIDDTTGFAAGDYIKLGFNDSTLLTSSWAYGTVGQIVKIVSVTDSQLVLNSPMRLEYDISKNPTIIKLNVTNNVGIECLKIHRVDATVSQTSNISYNYAAQCWISGIESYLCNFAHVALNNSTNVTIEGSYFKDAHAYGGGGQGYGVMCQSTTNECRIENNVFEHLRHSMILQSGANGNVFGYNYSINPFWTEPSLPSNSAGDMVLHGNYPYCNLFEGNIGQNIVIDNSHGQNGDYNTFFRNRGELFGIFMNSNPASNNQNFVGNEITNSGFLLGNYALAGTGHFQHGNNVKGTIYASGTTTLTDTSYYLTSVPYFLQNLSSWPSIGIPNSINTGTIPAKERYSVNNYTTCSTVVSTGIVSNSASDKYCKLFPNPTNGKVYLTANQELQGETNITVYSNLGNIIFIGTITKASPPIDLSGCKKGIYFVRIESKEKQHYTIEKLILQ